MSKKETTDTKTTDANLNVPATVADGGEELPTVAQTDIVPAHSDDMLVPGGEAGLIDKGYSTGEMDRTTENALAEPRNVVEYNAGSSDDDRMSGGYASVRGSTYRKRGDKLVWIVLIVMTVVAIAIGVCSSLITAHLMRKGETPPIINTKDDISQVTGVIAGRKSCVASVNCGTLNGSGIVMKRDGDDVYVLTNAHVILGYIKNGTTPSVRFFSEDSYYNASVVGYDTHYDAAVLIVSHETVYTVYDIDGSDYFKPNTQYNEGDRVVSMGNAMGLGIAYYDGIISRKSELLECDELVDTSTKKTVPVLRTTAVINAGMSGGPLFDMHGNLIGMGTYRMSNSAGVDKEGNANTDVEDTGFVVPISVLYPVYRQILRQADGGAAAMTGVNLKRVNTSAIGWIGTPFGFNIEYRNGKAMVISLDTNLAPSGVMVGDTVTRIGGYTVTDDICATVGAMLSYTRSGGGATLSISFESAGSRSFGDYRYAL